MNNCDINLFLQHQKFLDCFFCHSRSPWIYPIAEIGTTAGTFDILSALLTKLCIAGLAHQIFTHRACEHDPIRQIKAYPAVVVLVITRVLFLSVAEAIDQASQAVNLILEVFHAGGGEMVPTHL